MQDRFKFRCWHKKRKKMYDVLHLHVGNFSNGGDWVTANGFNIITQQDMHIQIQPKDCIIMQCTGLKDKNCKLIYEGDIVKIKGEIFFIKYEIGSFLIIRNYQSLDCWYEMFTECWNDDVYPLSQLWIDKYIEENYIDCIEVIGNIYENPELLESEQA